MQLYFRSYYTSDFKDVINYFREVNPSGPGLRFWQAGPFNPPLSCSRVFSLMSLQADMVSGFLKHFQLTIKICARDF